MTYFGVNFPAWRNPANIVFTKLRHKGRLASFGVLLLAASLRFISLRLKPFHNDEGVNGYFMTALFSRGFYHYDPTNYHGPSLYYLALITTTLNSLFYGKAGLSDAALRIVPALLGVALVWLVLQLRRSLGRYGALGAAALIALSPGAVYFSRYFIHEIPFVVFTLGIVVAVWRYHHTARPVYLLLASASAALLAATKETSIITLAVLFLAYLCARVYLSRSMPSKDDFGPRKPALPLLASLALFLVIHVLLFSSFFSNFPQGVYDSVLTYRAWMHTGASDDLHSPSTYLLWLWQDEAPSLLLGAAGFLLALYRRDNRFAIFSGFWAMGMLAAYSLIPYKTPWLTLNISVPLAIVGGYCIQQICNKMGQSGRKRISASLVGVVGILMAVSAYQAIDLSFFHYDDNSLPYVYAGTTRQLFSLIDKINEVAARAGTGTKTGIMITSPEHWPLPWNLRNYPNAGYWGRVVPPSDQAIVIGKETQEDELRRTLGDKYVRVGSYELRPGVVLVLFVRRDLSIRG